MNSIPCWAITLVVAVALLLPHSSLAADHDEIAEIHQEIQTMKSEYEARIASLEARLQAAEQATKSAEAKAESAQTTAGNALVAAPPVAASAPASASAFNPAIGLILDAKARYYSRDVGDFRIPGFSLPHEGGLGVEGLGLGESELNFYANVDDKFYGSLTTAVAEENGDTTVSVEEAFIQTLTLPVGLTVKAGRFFSNIGYLNSTHAHADDFADRPLPNRIFLNGQFGDDGVQVRWLAPTDLYVELGGELLRGASYPAGGGSDNGKGTWTAFGHVGGDLGDSQSWRAGLSYLSARANHRDTGDPDAPDLFSGNVDMWIVDAVWKWAPNGDAANRNFKLQGEYFARAEKGRYTPAGGVALPLSFDQDGFYVQSIYQFMPQWRIGLRYAQLEAERLGSSFAGTALDERGRTPWDVSAMIDWSNTEFSRIRLQYNRDESGLRPDDQVVVQYIMSLGAHGAHQF